MALDPETLYRQLGQIIAEAPDLAADDGPLLPDTLLWLGRATALVTQVVGVVDQARFTHSCDHLNTAARERNAEQIMMILYRALALAEAKAPPGVQGAFIPAGAAFDALQAAVKVLGEAKADVLIVDPYMDAKVLTDFAPLVPERVVIRLLSDSHYTKPNIVMTVAERWIRQYGGARPLEVRQTAPRALHDRLIFVDSRVVWALTQSLKDFASRAPASVLRVDGETAKLKLEAYGAMWAESARLL